MKRFFTKYFLLIVLIFIGTESFSQNSMLVNFGSSSCSSASSIDPSFAIVKDPLTSTPSLLANCDFSAQLPNYFSVYIAYNPKDNKLYISSIQDFVHSKVWTLDVGLPDTVGCPAL
ncbi:MAG TPA: hypothetical protein VK890_11505, partial [Bacteroidia bacterium]|nr:hypothetical protein [Bacteroidia bacterium]